MLCVGAIVLERWCVSVVFFNDTATTEIYTLSLHDALPISARLRDARLRRAGRRRVGRARTRAAGALGAVPGAGARVTFADRSEEHTSELQSRQYLVCRLLLEKKKRQRELQIQRL